MLLTAGESGKPLYATTLSPEKIDSFPLVLDIPLCIQEQIDKKSELRITVVGKKIFAVNVSADDAHHVDIRIDSKKRTHTIYQLPKKLRICALNYVDIMDWSMGLLIWQLLRMESMYSSK